MLMNINCSAVISVALHLTFDDDTVKDRVIGVGDIVDITYNDAGMRKNVEGKVLKVSCSTEKPTGWYIIIDGSNTMAMNAVKLCPMNILDCEIIYKSSDVKSVGTPITEGTVAMIRVINNELQFSPDTYNWYPINIDYSNIKNIPEVTDPDPKPGTDDSNKKNPDSSSTPSTDGDQSSDSSSGNNTGVENKEENKEK